jgi:hypothetical protein
MHQRHAAKRMLSVAAIPAGAVAWTTAAISCLSSTICWKATRSRRGNLSKLEEYRHALAKAFT